MPMVPADKRLSKEGLCDPGHARAEYPIGKGMVAENFVLPYYRHGLTVLDAHTL